MTILVTGATGNIGSNVVRELVRDGRHDVRAMTRDPDRASVLPTSVEVAHGDFSRPETWDAVLSGVSRLYLFPAVDPTPAFGPTAEPGFIERAVRAGVRRIVVHSAIAAGFDSSGSPDDPGLTPLQRHLAIERDAHRAIERAVEESGVEWTHVRPGLLAVGALDWAEEIRATATVRAPYPRASRPLVHEADVAEIAAAALLTDEHVGLAHEITGPRHVSQVEQVAAIADAIGVEIAFVELDPEQARAEWFAPEQGMDEEVLGWLLALLETCERDELLPVTGTYERITGRPARDFRQWARDHAATFRPSGG